MNGNLKLYEEQVEELEVKGAQRCALLRTAIWAGHRHNARLKRKILRVKLTIVGAKTNGAIERKSRGVQHTFPCQLTVYIDGKLRPDYLGAHGMRVANLGSGYRN